LNDHSLPLALESLPEIFSRVGEREPAFFLDLDGTLAPFAPHPDLAEVPTKTRGILASMARNHVVCFVSGRGLADLRDKIGLVSAYYAADHGYSIAGPPHSGIELEMGAENRYELEAAAVELKRRLKMIDGAVVESKGLSLSVHYRLVAERERPLVRRIVADVAKTAPGLSLTAGKLVHELGPRVAWGKGRAMLWLLERLGLERGDACPICLGDDLADEDMFAAAGGWGVSLVVGDPGRPTRADYMLRDCDEAATLLWALTSHDDWTSPQLG
jgi:trehalose-phosphatase